MTAYGQAALDAEIAALRSAGNGARNHQLNRSTFAVAQLVAGEQLEAEAARRALYEAANEAGLDKREIEATVSSAWKAGSAVPRYPYRDAGGRVAYAKARIDRPGRKYQYQHCDGSGNWKAGRGGAEPIPYRLPELIAAPADAVIFMAEGEKHADKLAGWGLVATSHKDWQAHFARYVAGRDVVILPDNDEAGRKQAERARAMVADAGGRPVLLHLPRLPEKGDVCDWDGDRAEFAALVEQARASKPTKLLPLLNPAAWDGEETPSREWAWDGFIPHRQATYLTGPGSAGKSLLTQQLCTAIAMGLPFMGEETRQTVAIYVTCEDDADELHLRQKAICEAMSVPLSALSGKLHLVSLAGAPGNELVTFTPEGKMVVQDAFRVLQDTARATGARFIVLDNVAHLFAGNENIRNQVAAFVSLLNGLAAEIDGSVLFLGHPNKAGQDFSGSTAWENQVRSRLFMEVPKDDLGNTPDPDARHLTRGKANYARNGETLTFRWHKWAFVRDEDLPEDTRAELAEVVKANGENAAFLACLRARTEQGDGREVGPSSGPNYAPSQFEGMPQARGFKRAALKRAMDRLYEIGKIKSETVMDRKAKREKTIIVEVIDTSHNVHNAPHNACTTQPHNTAQRPHNRGSAHTLYTTYITGAAHGSAAPYGEEQKRGNPDDDGLDENGDIIGWND